MFKVNAQTVVASKTNKMVVGVIATVLLVTACGVPDEPTASDRDIVAAVSDPGPPWQPSSRIDDAKVQSFGVFEGPAHTPNYGLLDEIVGAESRFGVFAAPQWAVSQSALDQALGIDRDAGILGDSEPQGHPNYGRLETYLGLGTGTSTGPH